MNNAAQVLANAAPVTEQATEGQPAEGAQAAPAQTVDPSVSPKLGLVARKEAELLKKQRQWQAEKEAFEKEKAEILNRMKAREEEDSLWEKDPLAALEKKGLSYQALTERQLAGGDIPPKELAKQFEQKLTNLQKQLEDKERAAKEAEEKKVQEEHERVITNYKNELKSYLAGKKDEHKLAALFDNEAELVYDTIDAYYQEHGKVLSNEEASSLVNKFYMDKLEEGVKTLGWQLIKETGPKEGEPQGEEPAERFGFPQRTGPAPKVPKTLTNSMQSSTVPSYLPAQTEDERIKRAMAALQ